ncbi:MAG: alpha/beta fold hydrolase [Geobacteraceae bacterium]|nr:alpha/beta fold hydrolase [Geobacteraceae bacterium]
MKALVNGISLSYEDVGSGPAVVLLHGFPLNRRMWGPQQEALICAGFRLIAPDLRGFGESDAPDGSYTMSLLADDIVSLMDHLGIRQAVLGGMSMGGYVLFNLLERYPDRASAACFITTRSTADDEGVKSGRLALLDSAGKYGAAAVAELFAPSLFADVTAREKPGLIRELCDMMISVDMHGVKGALMAMLGRKDYTSLLDGFTLPSLVIGAEQDSAVRREDIRLLADRLPHCELCMIPEAGHMANLEQPSAFNECLLNFLGKIPEC